MDINVSPESAGIIEEVLVIEGMKKSPKAQVLGKLNTEALCKGHLDELKIQQELGQHNF